MKQSKAVQYGIILGIVSIIIGIVMYLMGPSILKPWWLSILIMLLVFILVIGFMSRSAIEKRTELGGYISFKDAFQAAFTTIVVSTIISLVFNLLLFGVIDKNYGEEMQDATVEMMEDNAERFGMSDEVLEKQIKKIESKDSYSFSAQLKSSVTSLFVFGLIGLLVAVIVRRNDETMA